MGTGFDKSLQNTIKSMSMGLVDFNASGNVKGGWENEGGWNVGKGVKRMLLNAATLGTSSINTGAGQYGDETVADSLFPKTVNDAFLDDRTQGRKDVDAKSAAEVGKATREAASAPDITDALLKKSMMASAQRMKTGQGRRSTFLSGPAGDISKPSKKSLLGGGY